MRQEDGKTLLRWFEVEQRDLPWRRDNDPYAVTVSEFMLQQTTVAAVKEKYLRWMERFPTPNALAEATTEEVMSYWSGLGYYQRARRLHKVAQTVRESGRFPDSYEGLLELPGFGPYTAAAVASICFERPVLAVDTNVIRVLYRYYALSAEGQDIKAHRELHKATQPVLSWADPGVFNQALMELGASLCSVKEPACLLCPLKQRCRGRVAPGGPQSFPLPKRKKEAKKTQGTALVVQNDENGKILLIQGTSLGLLAQLYQPLLFFEEAEKEHPLSEVMREIAAREERLGEQRFVGQVKYGISGRKMILDCRHMLCDREAFWEMEELLERRQISTLKCSLQEAAGEERFPLSTLTRRVLRKVEESF